MTIAATVKRCLDRHKIGYEVLAHPYTGSSSETAQASHISGDSIAKAVLLRDGKGFLLAVVPASHHLRLDMLESSLGRPVSLASESEVSRLFPDCEFGAIPPVGDAYGLDVILDEALAQRGTVYFEGGDHQSLVKVAGEDFHTLVDAARHGRFSTHD